MKKVVTTQPSIPSLNSKEVMEEIHEDEVPWMLGDLCSQEVSFVLPSTLVSPLCVDLILGLALFKKHGAWCLLIMCEELF